MPTERCNHLMCCRTDCPDCYPTVYPGKVIFLDDDKKPGDPISPAHYRRGSIEVIDFISDQQLTYNVGAAVKYLCRYRDKAGAEDLRKAIRYIEFEIAALSGLKPSEAL